MAQQYIPGVGWVDDGSGSSGTDTNYYSQIAQQPAQQSPYVWNQTYQQPQPTYQAPVTSPFAWNQTYQQPQTDPFSYTPPPPQSVPSFDYNPETPFSFQDYQKPQPFGPPLPPAPPQADVANFYEQESYAQPPKPEQPDIFNLNGGFMGQFDQSKGQAQPGQPRMLNWFSPPTQPQEQDPAAAQQANPFDLSTSANMPLTPPTPAAPPQPKANTQDIFTSLIDPTGRAHVNQLFGLPDAPDLTADFATRGSEELAGAVGNVLGAPFALVGNTIDTVANSNVPVVGAGAKGIQSIWSQGVEPILGITPSLAGDVAAGRYQPYQGFGLNPFAAATNTGETTGEKLGDWVSTAFDPQKKAEYESFLDQATQQDYAEQIAQGATPEQATQHAQMTRSKLLNPFNYAEYQGLQDFSKLPASVQLAVQLADPIGNKAFDAAVTPITHGLPRAIGKVAEKTGATQLINNALDATIRPGTQKAFRFGQTTDRIASTLDEAALSAGTTAADVLPDFLFNMASPLYHEKLIPNFAKDAEAQEIIARTQRAYQASTLYKGKGGDTVTPAESSLGQNMQDTGQRPAPVNAPTNGGVNSGGLRFKVTGTDKFGEPILEVVKAEEPASAPASVPNAPKPISKEEAQNRFNHLEDAWGEDPAYFSPSNVYPASKFTSQEAIDFKKVVDDNGGVVIEWANGGNRTYVNEVDLQRGSKPSDGGPRPITGIQEVWSASPDGTNIRNYSRGTMLRAYDVNGKLVWENPKAAEIEAGRKSDSYRSHVQQYEPSDIPYKPVETLPAPKPVDPNDPFSTPEPLPATAASQPDFSKYVDPTFTDIANKTRNADPNDLSSNIYHHNLGQGPIRKAEVAGESVPDWALKADQDYKTAAAKFSSDIDNARGNYKGPLSQAPEPVKQAVYIAGAEYKQATANYLDAVDRFVKGEGTPTTTTPPKPPTPEQVAADAASQAGFDAIKSAAPDAANPRTAEPVALPDRYKPVKLPYRDTGDASEFFNAAKTMQGIDVKALRPLEGAKTPTLRPAKPLEEWGAIGKAIRGVNQYTTVPLSRLYLETLSRAVRDPASNLIKYGVQDPEGVAQLVLSKFGVGNANAIATRFKQEFGDSGMETLGHASMAAEIGGGRGSVKSSGAANLLYHAANPFNELTADVLRGVSGGKFKSYSDFIEKNENAIKEFMYMREALRTYDDLVTQGPKTEFFQKNPQLYKDIQSGKLTVEQLNDVIRGRIFNGFDMNDLRNGTYNPAMPSQSFNDAYPEVVAGLGGTNGNIIKQGIGSLVDRVKEQNEVNLINRLLDSGTRVPGGDISKVNPKVVARARAAINEIKMSDLDSNHPLVQQMVNEALDALDANLITMFPKDKLAESLSNFLADSAARYVANSRRYDMFIREFNNRVAKNEPKYTTQFKAPPTDFSRMMELKDKYEAMAGLTPQEIRALPAGERLTPKQIEEYEQLRDAIALPYQAADAGVVLPNGNTLPPPANLPDYSQYAEAFGNPQINRLKVGTRTVQGQPTANVGVAMGGNGRYNLKTGKRLPVGTEGKRIVYGNVLTPEAMQKIAGKFNRTDTFTSEGKVYNKGTTAEQMNQYFHDFLATDQYYRKVTNNTFKLDPTIAAPVRISDGVSFEELMGRPRPPRVGPEVISLGDAAKQAGYDLGNITNEQLADVLKTAYGEDAMRDFDTMEPGQRNLIQQDISRELLGVDPIDPLTSSHAQAEHARATEILQSYLDDMDARKKSQAEGVAADAAHKAEGAKLEEDFTREMKNVTDSLLAERFRNIYAAKTEAYKTVKGTYFDYRDKNRIDQVLGTVLPFQYWARQNFAYLARYFSAHPYHFAAILNFYKNLEQENSDPSIPPYGKFSIKLWDIAGTSKDQPGGQQHMMWDIGSLSPFTPFNSSQVFGGLVIKSDDDLEADTVANSEPLGILANPGEFLFGKDIYSKTQKDPKTGKPKVIGRDKGVLSAWVNPNPLIKDTMLQTGLLNKGFQATGLLGSDQTTLGQDYPEETRAQHASLSIAPGASVYPILGAATGVSQKLRDMGVIKGELNLLGPANEMLYGRNAGKPQTAIYQEINRMVVNKEITAEQGKLAIAAYKDGTYASVPLTIALDRVYADQLGLKAMSLAGLSAQLYNTPRQQITNQLYDAQGKAYDAGGANLPGYKLDANGNAAANTSAVSKFYNDNPAASVLSTEQSNDTPETIRAGLADDKTYDAIAALKAKRKDGSIDYPTYTAEVNKLQGENPTFFKNNPYYATTPDQAKYETMADQYRAIGGQNFDDLQTKAYALLDKGDENGYKAIVNSPAYKTASNQRLDFLLANPSFQAQYAANNDQYAKDRTRELVGGVGRTNLQMVPKPAKTLEDLQYTKTTNEYYDIGGDKFDQLQAKAYTARDNGDDATFKKILASPEYQAAQKKRNDFIRDNPDWYAQRSEKIIASGGTGKYSGPLPPTPANSQKIPQFYPKAPKTIADINYSEQLSDYYAKGGDSYDKMQADVDKYFNAGQDTKAYAILNSRDYQRVQSTLDQFKLDNPDFAKRFDAEYTAKYGKPPKSEDEKIYDQQQAAFYNIGGARFDQLQKQVSDLFDKGQSDKAYAIEDTREYKAIQASRDQYLIDNPDFATRYNTEYASKYGKAPKTDAEKEYSDLLGQYSAIGGAKYDALAALANQYYDSGDKQAYYAIADSDDYKQMKSARKQFLADHPDFAKQYQAELDAKYGPQSSNTTTTTKSTGGSSGYTSSSSKKKTSSYTYYPKTYSTKNRSTGYTNTNTKKTVTSPAGYVNPFSLPVTDSRNPFFIPGKSAAPTSRTSFNGTVYPAAPARNGTPSTKNPPAGNNTNTWDAAQKKEYAYWLGKGKSKAYAAAAANNFYKPKPWESQ